MQQEKKEYTNIFNLLGFFFLSSAYFPLSSIVFFTILKWLSNVQNKYTDMREKKKQIYTKKKMKFFWWFGNKQFFLVYKYNWYHWLGTVKLSIWKKNSNLWLLFFFHFLFHFSVLFDWPYREQLQLTNDSLKAPSSPPLPPPQKTDDELCKKRSSRL